MAKNIPDLEIDGMLQLLEGDEVHVCSAQPTTAAEAKTTFQLATKAVVGGDYALANGDVSGRKNTLTPAPAADIDNTGTATHVAVTDATATILRTVTTCTSQAVTAGGTLDINPYAHEIRDVT